ncbi:lysophospholipid acyltransferase family protein [Desulfurobacterium thermolithotrophum]|uniref:lysophospholipid acyltransferase family protein n=1 Tax=Desulfurobacterium thermolithotrophum TaxID=64160 RepID=UPI0013D37DED|nr:lysophospholipid acyltransferase family protein [Desulfurobacterium thermolithotrophum]
MKLSREDILFFLLNGFVKTLKIEVKFLENVKFPSIITFWHGRMFLLPFVFANYADKVSVLISRHRDGELAARLIEKLGFSTVRGSTGKGKGGDRAFREMVNILESGKSVAITPDGPRGPKEVFKPGAAKLSIVTGVPVYPVAFSTSRGKELSSWDNFLLPYPFSKCKVLVGKPLYPKEKEDIDFYTKRLELALKDLTKLCDQETGWKI